MVDGHGHGQRRRILRALCISVPGVKRARAAGARRRGMQTAKGKAEAQGRKAKVGLFRAERLDEMENMGR